MEKFPTAHYEAAVYYFMTREFAVGFSLVMLDTDHIKDYVFVTDTLKLHKKTPIRKNVWVPYNKPERDALRSDNHRTLQVSLCQFLTDVVGSLA